MNVGDYVRTINGEIYKLIDDFALIYFQKEQEHGIPEHQIIKSSPQIIDLIEKDDLLKIEYRLLPNATQTEIVQVIENKDKKLFVHLWTGDYFIEDISKNGMIKQILTHEQFESEAYRVEE